VHHLPLGIIREFAAQRVADLLWAPPLVQPFLHELAQHRIMRQLAPPQPGSPIRSSRCALNGRY